jgi:hypothetical protein
MTLKEDKKVVTWLVHLDTCEYPMRIQASTAREAREKVQDLAFKLGLGELGVGAAAVTCVEMFIPRDDVLLDSRVTDNLLRGCFGNNIMDELEGEDNV